MKVATELAEAARAMLAAYGNCGSPRQQKAADALQAAIDKHSQYAAVPELIEEARAVASNFGDGYDVEVDDDAQTSLNDHGVWVSAWVHVPEKEEG